MNKQSRLLVAGLAAPPDAAAWAAARAGSIRRLVIDRDSRPAPDGVVRIGNVPDGAMSAALVQTGAQLNLTPRHG